ncbi:MAG: flagellar export protein FliJ [Leptospirillia bacterium]
MKGGIELVHRLAEVTESVARRELAEAVGTLRAAETRVTDLQAERAVAARQTTAAAESGSTAAELAARYRYIAALEARIDQAGIEAGNWMEQVTGLQGRWLETRREQRGLARVIARRREREIRERERRMQQEVDDMRRVAVFGKVDVDG